MEIKEKIGDDGQVIISVEVKGLQEFFENKQRVWDLVTGYKSSEVMPRTLHLGIFIHDSGCCWNIIALIRDELAAHAVVGGTFGAVCVSGELFALSRVPGGEVVTIGFQDPVEKTKNLEPGQSNTT